MPDPDQFSLEDNEEEDDTQKYFFLRYRDSTTVIFLVAVQDGKVKFVKKEVYREFDVEKPEEEEWIIEPKGGNGRRSAK